ncbi:MAG TPA: UDP-N-acetylglucosamine--N-acetylmuramyl-(pentapeptide) pyrophosphoryl-undecaprenol N-acetylglucosamine transferase [Geminicoccus sp.]|jgi:UDP-N-acetylglucosamine--N-acetylmuramyl-(pentapeptide) pyrophosphoryl-undecaprenol N-acetylglucosamine transferase|uniref:UDP-N-acetylglucosamine--N-acetylmuramyl- (pentapeptide) pyrophosphoryl-undecaprenol N-acetylglucosamine transferase n=1 Tax=Geminicoccus sp. TaxID=2024832 RepID=UPI002E32BF91|nr:UDP-N-acetylglucosamine--N-acetylmuramyl-(pentapeptide) pyrophosphoryl-undecaprenol N-acetylglucosamine transferase [Geminicoccus sp.]HEX2527029.1 UDP-N-acetylglucosamine--N-acetylmuramyl-(pentapeptide) pyrophosphoryl-undecaprenol N-acetylglucosamine transferase [Geminicoccus sp.]
MSGRVVIASGGTGGHMFPALALADEIIRRGHRVALVVDERGRRWVKGDYEVHVVAAARPGLGVVGRGLGVVQGFVQCLGLFRRWQPQVAACFGGYASFPPAMAARALGRPVVVHEQNAVLGKANRVLAAFARKLALSFARTDHAPPLSADTLVTGNPLRTGFEAQPDPPPADGPIRLFVMGGSQGARIFSAVLPEALALLAPELRGRLHVVQQARPEDVEQLRARYEAMGVPAEIASFFDDVARRLADCHLVVARSGASTVAEVSACGRPALYVPYAHAADDHQYANAMRVADAGAGHVLREADATPARLAAAIGDLLGHPAGLAAMAQAARGFARPDATVALADLVLSFAEKNP